MANGVRWWTGDVRERFWLEATDRVDIGTDLKAPMANVRGSRRMAVRVFRGAAIGGLVFRYDGTAGAITSVSRIAGPEVSGPIVWVARGTYVRECRAKPEEVPGYVTPRLPRPQNKEPKTCGEWLIAAGIGGTQPPGLKPLHTTGPFAGGRRGWRTLRR
jgi:hypothetical protein